jgi:flagellar biosynthesis/type III secretory pathway M-ring protein FliF/YscJ
MISESKIKTDRSVPSGTPPAVGVTANAIDPTAPNSLQSNTPDGGVEMKENTSEEKKEYRPTISREDKVEYVPRLLRLSVALFLDKSLEGEEIKLEDLESAIKASVGFTQDRDVFSSVIWPFAGNEPVEVVGDAVPESAPSEPNSMFDKLFERGLEIGTGLIFLTLLLRSLKKSAAPSVQRGPGGRGPLRSTGQPGAPGEIDPELLARLQIENLLDSDPDKLGDVLTQWIQEDEPVEAK